ncbi:hypothetical protein FQA39_LY03631 [Lamprigera yunnana]|nr:hypothetical protein FQA39_LY03631 [Lamprigera yunnana]
MGNTLRKFFPKASSSTAKDNLSETFEQFYNSLRLNLTKEHIDQLQVLFSFINLHKFDLSESMARYTNAGSFKQLFKNELKWLENQSKTRRIWNESLNRHCQGVLSIHVIIIQNLNHPDVIANVLNQIAISHCFISDIRLCFKMHDIIFGDVIKAEYQAGLNLYTHQALNKYIALISKRIQYLIKYFSSNIETVDILIALKTQKYLVQYYERDLDAINEVYDNFEPEPTSQLCLLPS